MATTYQEEVQKLNKEIKLLKDELLYEQLQKENYSSSLNRAYIDNQNQVSPKDLNPIIKQIRNKNLSRQEKQRVLFPEMYPSDPEDIFYQWVAQNRISIKRDRNWYWTVGLILIFIIFIAVLADQFMIIALALAFGFAVFVNQSIPAKDTIYKLTKQGIEIGEGEEIEIYAWGQLLDFAYYFKSEAEILYVETIIAMPERIMLLFSQEDRGNINMILESNLPYKPAPKKQSFFDKYVNGIYIPHSEFKALQEKINKYYDQKYSDIIEQLKADGRLDKNVSIQDIRKAENINRLKLIDEINRQQEEEAKRILGI